MLSNKQIELIYESATGQPLRPQDKELVTKFANAIYKETISEPTHHPTSPFANMHHLRAIGRGV